MLYVESDVFMVNLAWQSGTQGKIGKHPTVNLASKNYKSVF